VCGAWGAMWGRFAGATGCWAHCWEVDEVLTLILWILAHTNKSWHTNPGTLILCILAHTNKSAQTYLAVILRNTKRYGSLRAPNLVFLPHNRCYMKQWDGRCCGLGVVWFGRLLQTESDRTREVRTEPFQSRNFPSNLIRIVQGSAIMHFCVWMIPVGALWALLAWQEIRLTRFQLSCAGADLGHFLPISSVVSEIMSVPGQLRNGKP